MKNSNPGWDRIDEIMWYHRFRNVTEFSRHIGLKRPDKLYQIKRCRNNISFALADMICEKFPQISKGWLLCGEGEMLKKEVFETAVEPISLWQSGTVR